MSQYAREPRDYELMVILLPELAEDDLTTAIDKVSTYVTDISGEIRDILKDSPWGRRRLAYTIRFNSQDYRDGYYAIWHFKADPSSLGDLERELKLDTRVIRYLLVLEDPKWNSPQEREAAQEAANAPAVEETEAATEAPTEAGEAPAETAAVAEAVATTEDAATEALAAEEAVAEAPAAEETVAEAPVVEEVAADEAPAVEEAVAEAPAVEETVAEAPAVEEAAADETVAEEPATEEENV